jgi:hypothetical protein
MSYHINEATSKPNVCHKVSCSVGQHFETKEEAQSAIDKTKKTSTAKVASTPVENTKVVTPSKAKAVAEKVAPKVMTSAAVEKVTTVESEKEKVTVEPKSEYTAPTVTKVVASAVEDVKPAVKDAVDHALKLAKENASLPKPPPMVVEAKEEAVAQKSALPLPVRFGVAFARKLLKTVF